MTKSGKKVLIACIGHSMWLGAGVSALAWLLAGPKPLALIIGAVLGIGLGILIGTEESE
jgi:F0F1-type ATP synthase assembly protein I